MNVIEAKIPNRQNDDWDRKIVLKHKIIPLISLPSSALAMNYFIVRDDDDDLFVFQKKNNETVSQIKSFLKSIKK